MSKPTDLVQGTLDLLILKVVALEPMHGWAIAQRIRQMSGDVLQVGQSALYPSLHKLEQNGWISAEWAMSENNRRAKYYTLTKSRAEGARPGSRAVGAAGRGDLARSSGQSDRRNRHAPAPTILRLRLRSLFLPTQVDRSSTKNCGITWSGRSKKTSPPACVDEARVGPRARSRRTASNNGKRSVATCAE